MSECSSPVHQFYPTLPEAVTIQDLQKFSTLYPTLENFQSHNFSSFEAANRNPSYPYDTVNRSPLHSSQYTTSVSNNVNSSINQNIFGQVPNLGLYSGSNSPILNPLLSPSTSPVFGSYSQGASGTSVSSITQGMYL